MQKYLKSHSELSAATSNQGMASRIERSVTVMEEHMREQMEHLASQVSGNSGSSNSRLEQKINLMAVAIDRMIKGKTGEASSALVAVGKDKLRSQREKAPPKLAAKASTADALAPRPPGTPPRAAAQSKR